MKTLKPVLCLVAFALLLYVVIAGMAWQIRNPMGNPVTFWTHLPSALTFKRLPQFQEHP